MIQNIKRKPKRKQPNESEINHRLFVHLYGKAYRSVVFKPNSVQPAAPAVAQKAKADAIRARLYRNNTPGTLLETPVVVEVNEAAVLGRPLSFPAGRIKAVLHS